MEKSPKNKIPSSCFQSTIRHRAKSTAGTGRIGHGSATHQTANLCGKLHCASLPRPRGRAGALNLGDDSGRHEDLGTTETTEITERIPGRSVRGIHLLGRVSLLRILLSVISVISVVPRSSCLPESSSRLSAPPRPCGRGRLAQFSLLQRFAVWWVALPWPILPVPAVLLALCRVVVFFGTLAPFLRA